MSVINNFVNFMRMNGSDDDDGMDDIYEDNTGYLDDDAYDTEETFVSEPEPEREYEAPKPAKRYTNKNVAPMKSRRASTMNNVSGNLEVCIIKPVSIDEARSVTDTLLQERAVVLNLEGLDVDIAQRIIDFISGSCYAIKGNLQKISNYIFIITPNTVEISGDFQDIFGGGSDVSTI